MVTMWSVKMRPKPGFASMADRSAADTGAGFGRISKSRVSPPLMRALQRREVSWATTYPERSFNREPRALFTPDHGRSGVGEVRAGVRRRPRCGRPPRRYARRRRGYARRVRPRPRWLPAGPPRD